MPAPLCIEEEQEPRQQAWWSAAACNDGQGTLAALFFSDELQDIAAAKAVCSTCAVREPCLEGAIARREPWGVWGGQLFFNGRILAFKRKRGRPPKHRPAEVYEADAFGQEAASA